MAALKTTAIVAAGVMLGGCSWGPDSNDGMGKFKNAPTSKMDCVKADFDEGYHMIVCDYVTPSGDQCYTTLGESTDGISCFARDGGGSRE